MFRDTADRLLQPVGLEEPQLLDALSEMGFVDPTTARADWRGIVETAGENGLSGELLASLLGVMAQNAAPDTSLRNLRRCLGAWDDPAGWLEFLEQRSRAVEILIRLLVNSQFLTELVLKHPGYLQRLTESRRLSEVRSRDEFLADFRLSVSEGELDPIDAVRRTQRWELLRIAACDCFGLMDLRRITLQLSLLADATIQAVLEVSVAAVTGSTAEREMPLVVVALGKLGGEELNYSSDIDLLFLSDDPDETTLKIAQKLVRELGRMTPEGFLYRVDMRLRPWGSSGPLVAEVAAYEEYLGTHAAPWELQSLVKARSVAGDRAVGVRVLAAVSRLIMENSRAGQRETVREMKRRIEEALPRELREHGEVKSGVGSIRDIEFVTQFLQLQNAEEHPEVLGTNTLRSLTALAAAGCLRAEEYRKLSTGYLLLRAIEHSLQLMHNKQVHALPVDKGELSYLARRLDFSDADRFVKHYTEHCREIREVFDRVLGDTLDSPGSAAAASFDEPLYLEVFGPDQRARHETLLSELDRFGLAMVEPVRLEDGRAELTVVAFDSQGLLAAISGLLVVHGVDILNGHAFTLDVPGGPSRCVDTFEVGLPEGCNWDVLWSRYHGDLIDFIEASAEGKREEALSGLTEQVARSVSRVADVSGSLLPVEIDIDNDASDEVTVLTIRADDTVAFLYGCTHALSLAGILVRRVVIETQGLRVRDRLDVVDADGNKLTDPKRIQELKTVVVLTKQFTHLLPKSPNPLSALRQFRELLSTLLEQDDWSSSVATLEKPEVLSTLARLLGVSEFLWQDFLRLQYETLFPLLDDAETARQAPSLTELSTFLSDQLAECDSRQERVQCLNVFKDREMFAADMRHILWPGREFGQFSRELGHVAECVVAKAVELCCRDVSDRLGVDPPGRMAVVGLGKFGGRELGFASDIELVCVYDETGSKASTGGVSAAEFYCRVIERLLTTIRSERAGVFELDLRLRPHGQAGPLASSLSAFTAYYQGEGPAWPFERQALVKLRAVAGDQGLGDELESLRDEWIYCDDVFDVAAMRAMRDRQVRQLVRAGTFNAKLSPGGLVDCEYLVQGLQLEHGHRFRDVRATNTLEAIDALHERKLVDRETWEHLRGAYVFHRRLIDALRVVRGDARDLAVPANEAPEFTFLARRLDIDGSPDGLAGAIDRHAGLVEELSARLDPSGA